MSQILFIKWSDLHATNIPILDEQHRGIVEAINSLYYYMRKDRVSEVVIATMVKVEHYTFIHFLTEENLLEQAKYPYIDAHKRLHESFQQKSMLLAARLKKDPDAHELLTFLKQWWINHINKVDQEYVPYLQSYYDKKILS